MDLEVITRKPSGKPEPTPLLFVHGMALGAWAFDEYFLPFFAEQGYTAHALSLRYHGGSGDAEKVKWVPLSAFVEDVIQVVAGLDRPPVLVGHSMGGLIAQIVARDVPVAGLVTLASAPPAGLMSMAMGLLIKHPGLMLKTCLSLSLDPFLKNPEFAPTYFFSGGMSKKDMDRFFQLLGDESFRAFLDLWLPQTGIGRIGAPTLVMGAIDDPAISSSMVRATAKKHKTKAVFFPGSGHSVMLDVGWEKFARHILDWIRKTGFSNEGYEQ